MSAEIAPLQMAKHGLTDYRQNLSIKRTKEWNSRQIQFFFVFMDITQNLTPNHTELHTLSVAKSNDLGKVWNLALSPTRVGFEQHFWTLIFNYCYFFGEEFDSITKNERSQNPFYVTYK